MSIHAWNSLEVVGQVIARPYGSAIEAFADRKYAIRIRASAALVSLQFPGLDLPVTTRLRPIIRPDVLLPPGSSPLMAGVVVFVGMVCAVAAAAGVAPGIQAPPAFAGHWVLISVSPQRPAYDQFWLGTEARVTQTDTTLVITRLSPSPQREARFTLGAESRNEYSVDGQKIVRDSRATLSRGTLLISTDTTRPEGQRWLSNILRWSVDADGTLVVGDTEICGKGECPSVVTTLTFKRRS